MSGPRYQVFLSSTFRDLIAERQAVLEAILELNHFPAGMELFPASDSPPWQVIERIIDDSDYYVLVIGGKYGSTDAHEISFTEREYDYAVSTGKPVLAFLHGDPDAIPVGKSEIQEDARAKLDAVGLGNQRCREKERSANRHQRKKSVEYFARLCCDYRQSTLNELTAAISTRGDLRDSIESVREVINEGYDEAIRILEARQTDQEYYQQQLNDAAQQLWMMATRIHSHAEPLTSKE